MGTKSEVATAPLPSWGPSKGRKWYVTPVFSGFPNTKRGVKIRSGYLTPAFLGALKRAKLLRNPCVLGFPKAKRGDKIRSVGVHIPNSRGHTKV